MSSSTRTLALDITRTQERGDDKDKWAEQNSYYLETSFNLATSVVKQFEINVKDM